MNASLGGLRRARPRHGGGSADRRAVRPAGGLHPRPPRPHHRQQVTHHHHHHHYCHRNCHYHFGQFRRELQEPCVEGSLHDGEAERTGQGAGEGSQGQHQVMFI